MSFIVKSEKYFQNAARALSVLPRGRANGAIVEKFQVNLPVHIFAVCNCSRGSDRLTFLRKNVLSEHGPQNFNQNAWQPEKTFDCEQAYSVRSED